MTIKEIKEFLRPIEKLEANGVESLSNEELLAILLNTGTNEKNCIELSQEILNSLNSLNEFLYLDIEDLKQFKGIGSKKASLIVASIELIKRCMKDIRNGIKIKKHEDIYNILLPRIEGLTYEKLFVFYLDSKCRLIKLKEYGSDGASFVEIPTREIVNEAIKLKASAIILSHNHPSGDTTPSRNDISATIEFQHLLETLRIQLLDHIIVSTTDFHSLKNNYDIP